MNHESNIRNLHTDNEFWVLMIFSIRGKSNILQLHKQQKNKSLSSRAGRLADKTTNPSNL